MLLLYISVFLDIVLLFHLKIKSKSIQKPLRFAAFSVIIHLLVYYIVWGLNKTFGEHILFYIICIITGKIFIFYLLNTVSQTKNIQKPCVYLMIIAISLCVHSNPLFGVLCELILLLYLLYVEYFNKDETIKSEMVIEFSESSLYLRIIEENYRKSRALWHDLNNHILCMRSLVDNKQYTELSGYIDSLSEKISNSTFPIRSGNIVLDALIADKYHKAKKEDIYIDFETIRYRNTIEAEDLCVVLGNLFDNAIEENLRLENKKGRYIKLFITSVDDVLVIRLKNPLNHDLIVKNGLPFTTKPDITHHGIGLKNVRQICGKYNGELLWMGEDNVFEITVRLNITLNS